MEIAMVVAPMSQTNFKLAAQIGVSGVVGRYPGPRPEGSGADRIVGAIRPGVRRGEAAYAAMT